MRSWRFLALGLAGVALWALAAAAAPESWAFREGYFLGYGLGAAVGVAAALWDRARAPGLAVEER